jgi:hypothetical protein
MLPKVTPDRSFDYLEICDSDDENLVRSKTCAADDLAWSRYDGFHDVFARNNLIFECRVLAVQRRMSETRIVDGVGETAALLWSHDRSRAPVWRCATCNVRRNLHAIARDTGFCGDCLDRSRVLESDDIGGES